MLKVRGRLAMEATGLTDRALALASGFPCIAGNWAESSPCKDEGPALGVPRASGEEAQVYPIKSKQLSLHFEQL